MIAKVFRFKDGRVTEVRCISTDDDEVIFLLPNSNDAHNMKVALEKFVYGQGMTFFSPTTVGNRIAKLQLAIQDGMSEYVSKVSGIVAKRQQDFRGAVLLNNGEIVKS